MKATVDLQTTGHSSAVLFAFEAAGSVPLGGGQTLLALNLGSGEILTGMGVAAPGPLATFSQPIPSVVLLLSVPLTLQAMHVSGVTPFALSNAYDLTIGF